RGTPAESSLLRSRGEPACRRRRGPWASPLGRSVATDSPRGKPATARCSASGTVHRVVCRPFGAWAGSCASATYGPMRPAWLLVPFVSALHLLGCATGNGAFRDDGFHHDDFPYTVRYADAKARELLPNWRIDNYVVDDKGSPGQAKTTADYQGVQSIDLDGDGDPEKPTVYYYDLRLTNRRNSGVIWLQTVPLSPDRAERDL